MCALHCPSSSIVLAAGLATFRYLEVLSYGCVPVILADNWVPFLSELVDPSTYTITIPEKEVHACLACVSHCWDCVPCQVFGLVAVLRSIPRSRVHSLRAAGAMVYEEFFGNPARAALDLTQARVLAATAA